MTRVLGWLLLLAAGILSLPVAASLFDEQGSENWILPVQLGGMAVVGALVGTLLPLTSGDGPAGRRALTSRRPAGASPPRRRARCAAPLRPARPAPARSGGRR